MKTLKYILLYIPVVLISIMGFMYYGIYFFDFELQGIRDIGNEYQVNAFKEAYRMVNTGVAPLSLFLLIAILSQSETKQHVSFRVQAWFMILYFVLPKLTDHIFTVRKSYLGISTGYDAYSYNGTVMLAMIVGYIISCRIRIKHLKKNRDVTD